jgi:hypothetical protein
MMKGLIYLALSDIKPYDLPKLDGSQDTIAVVLSIVFAIIGAAALLIITISGFRYITSAGDPQKASQAKSSIVYALVGLIIAISAQAIVAFIVRRI